MNIWLIITILLVIIAFAIVVFGKEELGAKAYKALCAAAMSVIGVIGIKYLVEGRL